MTNPNKPIGATPNDKQTDTLRDARLAHALRHMPDAHMQPSAQTRSAVLQEAMRAVGSTTPAQPAQPPAVQRRWWHAWLGQPGQRLPWAAAVASVAVFGFITVMWYGQDVPDAAPERSVVAQNTAGDKAESAAPAAAPVAAPATAIATVEPRAKKKAAEPARSEAATPAEPEHTLAKAAPPTAAPVATPSAPAMADSVAGAAPPAAAAARAVPADSVAPSASVANNASAAADAPAAPARLERRSKAAPSPPTPAVAMAGAVAKARSDAAPVWQLTIGNAKRTIHPEQVQSLLAQLRGLVYGAAPVRSQPSDRPADAIRLELAGQESWVITPGHVTHYLTAGGGAGAAENAQGVAQANADMPQRSSITPAQYAALRRLAMELGAQP